MHIVLVQMFVLCLEPLVMTCQLWILRQTLANEKTGHTIIALECNI